RRLKARSIWQDWFRTHDAFLMPVSFVSAIVHDHRDMPARRIHTTTGDRPYTDLATWSTFSSLTGCPATVAPVGRPRDGLPVGIQIMGPFLEDATPLDLAARMGSFVPPPGF